MLNKLSAILNKIDSSDFSKLYQNLECLSITASSSYTTPEDIIKSLFVIAFDKKPSTHYTFSKNITKQASVQNSLTLLQKFLLFKKAMSFVKADTSLYNPEAPEGIPDFVNFPKYVEKFNRNPEKDEIEEVAETKEFGKVAKALGKYFIINPVSGNVTKLFLNAKGLSLINKKSDANSVAVVEQLIEEGASDYKDFLQQAIVDYAQNGSHSAKFREQIITLVPSYLKDQTSLSDSDWEDLGEWLVENSSLAKEDDSDNTGQEVQSSCSVKADLENSVVYEDNSYLVKIIPIPTDDFKKRYSYIAYNKSNGSEVMGVDVSSEDGVNFNFLGKPGTLYNFNSDRDGEFFDSRFFDIVNTHFNENFNVNNDSENTTVQSAYYDVIPKGNKFEIYEDGKLTATLNSLEEALSMPYKHKPVEVDKISLKLDDGTKVDMTNRAKKIDDGQKSLQLNAANESDDMFDVKTETEGMEEIETPEDKFKHIEEEKTESFSASDLAENLAYIKQNSPEEYVEIKDFLQQNLVGEDQKAYEFVETLENTNFQFTEATEESGLYEGHSQYQDLLQNKVLPLLEEVPSYQNALKSRVDPDKED